jgi:hypothetical protein
VGHRPGQGAWEVFVVKADTNDVLKVTDISTCGGTSCGCGV